MNASRYRSTTSSQISWEYLRRNQNYQSDERLHRKSSEKTESTKDTKGYFTYIQQTGLDFEAQKWGILAFTDPTKNRIPFWHPDQNKTTIAAIVQNREDTAEAKPFIPTLLKAKADVRGLRLLDGRLCLSISTDDTSAQLMFPPGTMLDETSSVSFVLPYGLALPIHAEQAKTLWIISGSRSKKVSPLAPKAS